MMAELAMAVSLACADFDVPQEACRRATEASLVQSGIAPRIDQVRSYAENEAKKLVDKRAAIVIGLGYRYIKSESFQYKWRVRYGFTVGVDKSKTDIKYTTGWEYKF
jgi:hypothetical protein